MSDSPKHTHDCLTCVFLGTHDRHDLYRCGKGPLGSYVARYGNDSHEYVSFPKSIVESGALSDHPIPQVKLLDKAHQLDKELKDDQE